MGRVPASLLFFTHTSKTPEGAFGKAPPAPSCCLSLQPPFPCPHTGSTHMWPPGRSSLVSIPSFSISICRKVLTFCRVSSSEYLQGCKEGKGCYLGFGSLPACHPSPTPFPRHKRSFHLAVFCPRAHHQARLSVLGKLKSCPLNTKPANQPTKQTNSQTNQ